MTNMTNTKISYGFERHLDAMTVEQAIERVTTALQKEGFGVLTLMLDALKGLATGRDAIAMTRDFVTTLYGAAESSVARGRSLKESMAATREAMDPKFAGFAIYEHCLPFNVSRAYDEASGIDDPVIWTDKRDQEMWAALQGGG